ncbi:DUF4914 family protein [Petroclostridium sp. X23]|uniref:DUF4914 family protein n=1 Tax=Petroclostridium sp. X23 TaxID=3045146 RepID=UPI0024AE7DBF|nr:DUF4914 family protein [Petroclostridium sp. X23]WHH60127.1 DUF4914 family protein [Petroclostridium sp. X23]
MINQMFKKFIISEELTDLLAKRHDVVIPECHEEILSMALGNKENDLFKVVYDVPGFGKINEVTVTRCNNGAIVNYTDADMRRRGPDCMVIADKKETDKPRYRDIYGDNFQSLRKDTFKWLKTQKLLLLPFMVGGMELGYPAILVAPQNAAFFAGGLADLQGFIPRSQIPKDFKPRAAIFLAPPFRHTHFDGKQVVVHNRLTDMHELFSYNLYPCPSAKKGIYEILLNIGEQEGWVTVHGSTVEGATYFHESSSCTGIYLPNLGAYNG